MIDPTKSYPLIIGLHGPGGSGAGFSGDFQIDRLMDEMGFVAALPDGSVERGGTARRHFWNATDSCCDFFGSGVDDVAYYSSDPGYHPDR